MNQKIFCTLFLGLLLSNLSFAQSSSVEVFLDHVTLAVSNLESAEERFSTLGFTIKEGRLHDNGLLNKHIKFKDGSAIELMTVQGEAKDDIAKTYKKFLSKQEGGIFIAFNAPFDHVMQKAEELSLSYQVSTGNPFSYITFKNIGLENVFFINNEMETTDTDSILTHEDKVSGIKRVWIQSSPLFTELLILLGASFKGILKTPDQKENPVYRLNDYDFIVDESFQNNPRILGIQFETEEISTLEWIPPNENHGVWITFR
tara:strand:+ start:19164 stop:19940 length:777 start_codon:yes stop_codon:yes gene_type:complete